MEEVLPFAPAQLGNISLAFHPSMGAAISYDKPANDAIHGRHNRKYIYVMRAVVRKCLNSGCISKLEPAGGSNPNTNTTE